MPETAVIGFFALMALVLIEFIGTQWLWPPVFALGIRVWTEQRPLPRLPQGTPGAFRTKRAAFRQLSPDVCIFSPLYFSDLSAGRSPFGLKCTIRWNGPDATIEGRLPLSSTFGWPAAVVVFAVSEWPARLTDSLLALAFLAALLVTVPLNVKRSRQLLDEYVQTVSGDDGDPSDSEAALGEKS